MKVLFLLFLAFSLQNAYISVRVYMMRTVVYRVRTVYKNRTSYVLSTSKNVHVMQMVRTVVYMVRTGFGGCF